MSALSRAFGEILRINFCPIGPIPFMVEWDLFVEADT